MKTHPPELIKTLRTGGVAVIRTNTIYGIVGAPIYRPLLNAFTRSKVELPKNHLSY